MANYTNSKKGKFGTTMGVTSIIAILVILVLVVFAALSYTTAKADYHLSKKTAEVTAAYYEADTRAEELVSTIARAAWFSDWRSSFPELIVPTEGETAPVLSEEPDGAHISFTEKIDETQELQVELLVSEDGKVSRLKWQVAPTGAWEPDTSLDLIQ